jgi:hypothetical protein
MPNVSANSVVNSGLNLKFVQNFASTVGGWAWLASKVIGGLAITVTLLLYFNQDRMLYMPNPPGFPKTPSGL